jgi:hypothetical protein
MRSGGRDVIGPVEAVPLQNASDRLIRNVVAEVGQRAGDPIIPPAGILLGHANDEGFDRSIDPRAPRT